MVDGLELLFARISEAVCSRGKLVPRLEKLYEIAQLFQTLLLVEDRGDDVSSTDLSKPN